MTYTIRKQGKNTRTWENFNKEANNIDDLVKEDIEETEKLAEIINAIIDKRNEH